MTQFPKGTEWLTVFVLVIVFYVLAGAAMISLNIKMGGRLCESPMRPAWSIKSVLTAPLAGAAC